MLETRLKILEIEKKVNELLNDSNYVVSDDVSEFDRGRIRTFINVMGSDHPAI